ncbi:DUF2785 domain-containing protein [Streptomyces roseolus]|uniref:DUF2785 domain-containing protein n=1 Tax=Streptomyces roseolus TaxID=67358 RepID=UPI003797BB69
MRAARSDDPEIRARAFAPLVLDVIVARGGLDPTRLAAFRRWYPAETDLRGHDARLGRLHAVAHGADLLGSFGSPPRTSTRAPCSRSRRSGSRPPPTTSSTGRRTPGRRGASPAPRTGPSRSRPSRCAGRTRSRRPSPPGGHPGSPGRRRTSPMPCAPCGCRTSSPTPACGPGPAPRPRTASGRRADPVRPRHAEPLKRHLAQVLSLLLQAV